MLKDLIANDNIEEESNVLFFLETQGGGHLNEGLNQPVAIVC